MEIMLSKRLRGRNFKNITKTKKLTTNMRIALKWILKKALNSHFRKN